MKPPWHSVPLLRPLLMLAAGMITYEACLDRLPTIQGQRTWLVFGAAILCYLVCSQAWSQRRASDVLRTLQSLSLLLVFFVLGLIRMHQQQPRSEPGHFLMQEQASGGWAVRIRQPPETTDKTIKANVDVWACLDSQQFKSASGEAIGYFQKSYAASSLRPGDVLIIEGSIRPHEPPLNPAAFDYGTYLKRQGIHGRFYCDSNAFHRIGHEAPSWFWRTTWSVRSQLRKWLVESLPEGPQRAIGMALLLGEKRYLGEDVRSAFADAGAMHLLAVSGLHVGIILTVSSWLLTGLNRYPRLKVFVLLLIIWMYALITGLSDSVSRAAVMFSFIVLGSMLQKPSHIYNSLSTSAMVLLIYDPNYLFRIGFQLSYAAVLGIVWVYPKMTSYWRPANRLLRSAWELTCVSVGAQLGTMVLAVAYFHQWPVYGVLSNIPVIILGTLTLYAGLAHFLLLALADIAMLPLHFLERPLQLFLEALYQTTAFFSQLPGAVIEPLYWSWPRLSLLSLCVASLLLFWIWRISWSRWFMPIAVGGLFLIHGHAQDVRQRTATLALYAHREGPIAGWYPPGGQYLVGPSAPDTAAPDLAGYQFALGGHWRKMGLAAPSKAWLPLDTVAFGNGLALADGCWQLDTARLLLSNAQHNPKTDSAMLAAAQPDWLWLARGAEPDFMALQRSQYLQKVILDVSLPPWEYAPMVDSMERYQIPVHDMRKQGAFLWHFER